MCLQQVEDEKKRQVKLSERQGKNFSPSESSGGDGGKWP